MTTSDNVRMRRLPARYAAILTPFFLSLIMTFVVSGISTVKVLGLSKEFLTAWSVAWGLSWLVAFPTVLVVLPLTRRIVAALVEPPGKA